MAVRFDASGDKLTKTTGLPSNLQSSFTVTGWARIITDRNDWSTFVNLSYDSNEFVYVQTSSDGLTWHMWTNNGNSNIYLATVDQWVYLILTISQIDNLATGGYILSGGNTVGWSSSISVSSASPTLFSFGDSVFTGEFLNGRLAYCKAWTTNLSDAELIAESNSIRPIRTADLWGFWPMFPGSGERVRDYSGNGNNLTEGGTLTDEEPPAVSWGAPIFVLPWVATGGATQDLAPSGIASAQAFGTAKLSFTLFVTGIVTSQAIGTASILRGAVNVSTAGIATAETFSSGAYLTYFPFEDDFTGADDEAWSSVLWVTETN
jgi:hypothetical protein